MSTSTYPNYRTLYRLRDPLANLPFRMSRRLLANWPTVDQQWEIARGKFQTYGPLVFDATSGGRLTDILWSRSVVFLFFSARLIHLLQEHSITGWSTYPVELYNRQGELLAGYQGIAITGSECARDRSRSQIVDKPPPVPGGRGYQVYRGLYFDESEWDGSDMFWVSEGGGVVITERVYKLFRKHKIRNVKFTPLSEVEIDVSNDKYIG